MSMALVQFLTRSAAVSERERAAEAAWFRSSMQESLFLSWKAGQRGQLAKWLVRTKDMYAACCRADKGHAARPFATIRLDGDLFDAADDVLDTIGFDFMVDDRKDRHWTRHYRYSVCVGKRRLVVATHELHDAGLSGAFERHLTR